MPMAIIYMGASIMGKGMRMTEVAFSCCHIWHLSQKLAMSLEMPSQKNRRRSLREIVTCLGDVVSKPEHLLSGLS